MLVCFRSTNRLSARYGHWPHLLTPPFLDLSLLLGVFLDGDGLVDYEEFLRMWSDKEAETQKRITDSFGH